MPFWRQTRRLRRDGNSSGSLSAVNGNFEFSSTFSLSADSRLPQFQSRLVAGRGNYQTPPDQQALSSKKFRGRYFAHC
jgi:hypothetical protein